MSELLILKLDVVNDGTAERMKSTNEHSRFPIHIVEKIRTCMESERQRERREKKLPLANKIPDEKKGMVSSGLGSRAERPAAARRRRRQRQSAVERALCAGPD